MANKTIQDAKANLESSISLIPERYERGVESANWKAGVDSAQANTNWKTGVQKAVSDDNWKKGVASVSNDTWKNAAMTKGKNSIAEGVRQGLEKYEKNFSPILSAMNSAAANLKPRTTDPIANIDNRVKPVVEAAIKAARK